MRSQSIECSICSERFGKCGGETSEHISITPCGHAYHQYCISKWLSGSEANTCPECRGNVSTNDLRPIYFNFVPMMDNMETYNEDLESEIIATANKMQRVKLQNMKLKNDFANQLREKDNEIHKLKLDFSNQLREKDNVISKLKLKYDMQNHQTKAKRSRPKFPEMLHPDQLFQVPVDMTAHNSNGMLNQMPATGYHQSQPSTSATMRMNESIPETSGVSQKSSSAGGGTQCQSSTDASPWYSLRQPFPANDDSNAVNSANLQAMYDQNLYFFPQRLVLPTSHHHFAQLSQSSMLQNGYISRMTTASDNSPMPMYTASNTATQQNVNYQQNVYMPQSQQPQPNSNINLANGNLSYVNGSNNLF